MLTPIAPALLPYTPADVVAMTLGIIAVALVLAAIDADTAGLWDQEEDRPDA